MCRIDAPFGNRPLDEKKDPVERFVQALDEFEVKDNFRTLLIKHFSENWIDIFYNSSRLEDVLKTANANDSELEKCIAIAFNQNVNFQFRLDLFSDKNFDKESLLFRFLDDVANTYFPTSLYGFYNAGIEKHVSEYIWFVRKYYGKEYFFTKAFFTDDAFCSVNEQQRTRILWDCFYFLAPQFNCLKDRSDESSLLKELQLLATSNAISESHNENSNAILLGLEFLKTWVKYDSEIGRLSSDPSRFFWDSPWEKLEPLIWQKNFDDEGMQSSLTNWINNTRRELEKLLLLNFNVDDTEDPEIKLWANHIDRYFGDIYSHIRIDFDWNANEQYKLDIRLQSELEELCSQLEPIQLKVWINWSIQQDFNRVLDSKQTLPVLSRSSEKWVCESFFCIWKELFLINLSMLEVKDQLHVLSSTFPARRRESSEFTLACFEWWRGLFNKLPEIDNFPKTLIPEWTIIATRCLYDQNLLPYIDKSIGILRKEISDAGKLEKQEKYCEQLKQLLENLDRVQPNKSFRHRLLLMRSSVIPLCDESVSLRNQLGHSSLIEWYQPIGNLPNRLFGNSEVVNYNEPSEKHLQPYIACSYELAEFCLSRLRLRKGEKAKDKKYTDSQVIEQSPMWRQSYLKALTELGLDLSGKVHKAVHFTKESDPDSNVREIASECYKVVRRKSKKKPTLHDLKRGIIAAEWWLLLCQRQDLGLSINSDEAIKTRRNLMRNP